MTVREWSPNLPGSDKSRIELLHAVKRLSNGLGNPPIEDVIAVAQFGVLSMTQVARVAGCRLSRVRGIYDAFDLPKPRTKGQFEHGAIDALIVICKKRAQKEAIPADLLSGLTRYVTPKMIEVLTGTPVSTYWYYHRKEPTL